jgi:hypothetical protein
VPLSPEFFRRALLRFGFVCALVTPAFLHAYNLGGERWGGTTVTMQLQLGTTNGGTLIDGNTSWNTVAEGALATWNANMTNIQFAVIRNSTAQIARDNDLNNVFWSSTVYGSAWDSRTLAITLTSYGQTNHRFSETDVLFNNNLSWNSYRGNLRPAAGSGTLYDFRRVALHEFGHALGLDHPDDVGQNVSAIMNAATSNTDNLTADDINGVRAIYDAPGSLSSDLAITGAAGYNFQGSTLNIHADSISNQGNIASNALRLELWAMPQHFTTSLPSGSQMLGAYASGDPLAAGASYTNLSLDTFYKPPTGGTYYTALLLTEFTGTSFAIRDHLEFSGQTTFSSTPLPSVTLQPTSPTNATVGGSATLSAQGSGSPFYQWQRNGVNLTSAFTSSYTATNLQPASTGVYQALISNSAGASASNFAMLGLTSSNKIVGAGEEVGSNIFVASNNNTFDQILLNGSAAVFRADSDLNQITRLSFIDSSNDIVQVEFAGPGNVSIVLATATGPAKAANYNQETLYMQGRAGIVVTGATEKTNLSVFSVGRGTAVNQALFKPGVNYDGLADIAFIAIQSSNGKFGGLRTSNAIYSGDHGLVGVYAPGVAFTGPVFVGNIDAALTATPALVLGSASDVRITGGDLLQTNGRPVQVSGITQLKMVDGVTSHYMVSAPDPTQYIVARQNKARLEQNGADVTAQIVVGP